MASEEQTEQQTSEEKKQFSPHVRKYPKRRHRFSYRATVIIAFIAIAIVTASLSIGVVAFIWNMYFQTYAASNIEDLAASTANRISDRYEGRLEFDDDVLIPARQAAEASDDLGVRVLSPDGQIIFDSSEVLDEERQAHYVEPSAATQIALAEIKSYGKNVGSVRVWAYGSEALLSSVDKAFQRNIYTALFLAAVISLVIASLLGIVFARYLVSPVNQITNTAKELSEGKLSARTDMRGNDELSHLGETLDAMAASLEKDRQLERRLTSDVAHELRTPLMAIQATIEAMIDGVYEADEERLIQVNTEVQRLSRMVSALLKLSRLENRSQPLNEGVVEVGDLIEGIVISHEVFVEDSGLKLTSNIEKDIKVMCDRDLIRQAVSNLISNAVRYTEEGGSINVSVRREGAMAVIDVTDTGIGLSPEEEKMVFSRFWRADAGRAKESGGLGIGLALVKEIVDRHGGKVSARGKVGAGSTFSIFLPLYDEEASLKQAKSALKAFEKRL